MNKTLYWIHSVVMVILLLAMLAMAQAAYTLWQYNQLNDFISHSESYDVVPKHEKAQFAQAFYEVAENKDNQALQRLSTLLSTDDIVLQAATYFNRANINLRAAQAMRSDDTGRFALIGLAKQDYRSALLIQPSLWDARFNLELSLLLLPEEISDNQAASQKKGSRSVAVKAVAFRVDLP